MWAEDDRSSRLFHVIHGSKSGPLGLPWLDADLAAVIAVNRHPGDDVALALDYRGDAGRPAVVGSDAWTSRSGYLWRPVATSFDAFANGLSVGS
jgi:hypothetical protein